MRLKLMTLRYSSTLGGFDETPLETFVKDKEVLSFREHFFLVSEVPHLLCVIAWRGLAGHASSGEVSGTHGPARRGGPKVRSDPCAGMDEFERCLFETLREWRRARAHEEGVPPYVVLTNKELSAIVRARPDSPTALGNIDGVGPAKVERYGKDILSRLDGASPAGQDGMPS